ncbi:MAG: hypothetical protein SO116_01315 [Treponema sp.]|nr:hypothetical protein [Treponema sp.]
MKKLNFITAALTSVALLFGSFGITSCSDSGDDDSSKKPVLADVITSVSLANDVTFTAGDALPTSEKFVVVARISGKSKTLTAEEFTVTTPKANIDNTETEALKLKMSGGAHNETVTLTIALADNPTVTKEFDIALSDGATVTKITATFDNPKTEYEVGDVFDWTGITVKGYYGEGDTTGEDITAKATCDFNSSNAAKSVEVTFTFGEFSATEKLPITIKEKPEEAPDPVAPSDPVAPEATVAKTIPEGAAVVYDSTLGAASSFGTQWWWGDFAITDSELADGKTVKQIAFGEKNACGCFTTSCSFTENAKLYMSVYARNDFSVKPVKPNAEFSQSVTKAGTYEWVEVEINLGEAGTLSQIGFVGKVADTIWVDHVYVVGGTIVSTDEFGSKDVPEATVAKTIPDGAVIIYDSGSTSNNVGGIESWNGGFGIKDCELADGKTVKQVNFTSISDNACGCFTTNYNFGNNAKLYMSVYAGHDFSVKPVKPNTEFSQSVTKAGTYEWVEVEIDLGKEGTLSQMGFISTVEQAIWVDHVYIVEATSAQ